MLTRTTSSAMVHFSFALDEQVELFAMALFGSKTEHPICDVQMTCEAI